MNIHTIVADTHQNILKTHGSADSKNRVVSDVFSNITE